MVNGNEVFWDEDSNEVFAEICAEAKTDEEKIMAAYNWIVQNMEFDETYETMYQYFDMRKTLAKNPAYAMITQICLPPFAAVKVFPVAVLTECERIMQACFILGTESILTDYGGVWMSLLIL